MDRTHSKSPTTAAQNDVAYQDAVAGLWAARGLGDKQAEQQWQAEIDRLTGKTAGKGLLAKLMSGGTK